MMGKLAYYKGWWGRLQLKVHGHKKGPYNSKQCDERVMISKASDDIIQRENLFHFKFPIKDIICSLIIDSGGWANVSTVVMVDFLKLLTTKSATPYNI